MMKFRATYLVLHFIQRLFDMKKNLLLLGTLLGCVVVLWTACKPDAVIPPNPYDDLVYPTPDPPIDTLDPNSLVAIQRDIFSLRCANPGCHDGAFEPDFRTSASSYSTLVYHPIIKNNLNEDFEFRVIPNDTTASVLHERLTNCCFVNQDDRMPQDNIGTPMEAELIQRIENWIMNGAPDMFGQVNHPPDQAPLVSFFLAYDTLVPPIADLSATSNRVDGVYYNPFIINQSDPTHDVFHMIVFVEDDSTEVADLQINKVVCSYDENDFSPTAPGYQEYTGVHFANALNPDESFWIADVNSHDFAADQLVFMRYYVSDGGNSVEFPVDESIYQFKTYWSFYTIP